MPEKKAIRIMAQVIIEIQTELEVEDAIREFEENCNYSFKSTAGSEVTETNWIETNRISARYMNNSNTEMIIKPLKNAYKPSDGS